MATFQITGPDGKKYRVTGENAEGAMKALQSMQGQFAAPSDYSKTNFAQGTSGLNEGLAGTLGLPVDLVNSAIGLGMKGVNKIAGTDFQPSEKPFLGSGHIKEMMGDAIQPGTDNVGQQMIRRTAQSVGGAAIPGAGAMATAAKPAAAAASLLASSLAGGGAAATARQLAPDNPLIEIGAELIGSLGTAGGINAMRNSAADKAARAAVPSVRGLKDQAGQLYDDAAAGGVTAPKATVQTLATDLRKIATDEGLISPTGRISGAYPKAKEAIRMLDDYAKGDMTVPQMQAARKTLADAAGSIDKSERRIASIMLDKFDDFTEPLAPQLKEARSLYHSAKKGEKLEEMRELAAANSKNFSASGSENALRTEYKGLNKDLIKGRERGWTPDEQAAVKKVAEGTAGGNAARNVGRMAPTGPMSFMATAGVPAAVGTAMGTPALGTLIAALMSGTGYAGRGLATMIGRKNADLAELLVRSQGAIPKGVRSDDLRKIAAALLAGQAGQ